MKVAVIVPTLNAGKPWKHWVKAVTSIEYPVDKVLVIDSGSSDDTVNDASSAGFDIRVINKLDFDHGRTRQLAVSELSDFDVLVYLTQDSILSSPQSLNQLLDSFSDPDVAIAYGRQLPRKMAVPIEAHARLFNYSNCSVVRSLSDKSKYGLKTAFVSNSFAAYRVSALNEIGGFPDNVIFGEDMYVAAKLLLGGYKIAYVADSCVYHSHNYNLRQDLNRYFDMGLFHACEPWIRESLGSAEGQGLNFLKSEFKYLLRHAVWLLPESLLRTFLRYTGFRLGLLHSRLPLGLCRWLSMNKGYFR